MNYKAFSQRCKEKGYSASRLVTELGISKSNITNWKNGGNPSYDTIIKLSQALECSVGFLLGTEDEVNCSGVAVTHELQNTGLASARTISFKSTKAFEDNYLNEISAYANTNIIFLCGTEKEYIPVERDGKQISGRGFDKLLAIFDNVNDSPIISNIQMQLSRIVLHNLNITSASQIEDKFLSSKADFILNDMKHKDSLRNYPFNLSDLLVLGDLFDKSIPFMISGVE